VRKLILMANFIKPRRALSHNYDLSEKSIGQLASDACQQYRPRRSAGGE